MKKLILLTTMILCSTLAPVTALAIETESFDIGAASKELLSAEQERYPEYHVEVLCLSDKGFTCDSDILLDDGYTLDVEKLREFDRDILLCFGALVYETFEFEKDSLSEDEQRQVEDNRVFLDGTFIQRFYTRDRVFSPKFRMFIKRDQLEGVDFQSTKISVALMPERDGATITFGDTAIGFDCVVQIDMSGLLLGGKYDIINAKYKSLPKNLSSNAIAPPEDYQRIVTTEETLSNGFIQFEIKKGDSRHYMVHGYELDRADDPISYFGG